MYTLQDLRVSTHAIPTIHPAQISTSPFLHRNHPWKTVRSIVSIKQHDTMFWCPTFVYVEMLMLMKVAVQK